jgi:hypothetical protein
MCDCIKVEIQTTTEPSSTIYQLEKGGDLNGESWWTFVHDGLTYNMWYDGSTFWLVTEVLGSLSNIYSRYARVTSCPHATLTGNTATGWIDPQSIWTTFTTSAQDCPDCDQQDRTKESFNSIKLPSDFVEDARGLKECFCVYKVLADPSSDTWKNDKTSAWLKVSDPSDTFTFVLKKNDVVTTYTPTSVPFPNESDAYYTTINWMDVLTSDGVGCYELKISYSISGITGELSWGKYQLEPYSIQNALNTARIRAIFNGYQEEEGIDFSGSDVESTFRFHGYIGNRQPNQETDNIIYNNREMKRVIRENLNSYEIITDPSDDCIIRPLVDTYLLSENQLFISDYNAHNPSYRYQDLPVIVSESPSLEYYDFSRKVKLTCVVSDKFKNKRTYYK